MDTRYIGEVVEVILKLLKEAGVLDDTQESTIRSSDTVSKMSLSTSIKA